MPNFLADLKIALRRLRRTPVFSMTAVIVLGLGIGVGIAVFNMFNAGWLKRAPEIPGAVRFNAFAPVAQLDRAPPS